MNREFGMVHVTVKENGFMQPREYSYRFEGDCFLFSRHNLLTELTSLPTTGRRFTFGGTSFIAVDIDRLTGAIIAVKDTRPFLVVYALVVPPITRWLKLIFQRCIVTLAIWNLAEVHYGEIVSLECIWRRWRKK
jgi:hypothetical protein